MKLRDYHFTDDQPLSPFRDMLRLPIRFEFDTPWEKCVNVDGGKVIATPEGGLLFNKRGYRSLLRSLLYFLLRLFHSFIDVNVKRSNDGIISLNEIKFYSSLLERNKISF